MRGLVQLVFLLTGMVTGIIRLISNLISGGSAERLSRKINNDPKHIDKITRDLTTIYNRFPISEFPRFFEKIMQIPDNTSLGKYLFTRCLQIDDGKLLCITKCTDFDFDIGVMGNLKDVKKVEQANFIIKKNNLKSQYEFYSEIFDDLNEKNLKTDFKVELLKFLQNR
jgi:hypothetical protein